MNLRTPILSLTLLVGVLGLAWWLGRLPQADEAPAPVAATSAVRTAEPASKLSSRSGRPDGWGPSPFGDGPVVIAQDPVAMPAVPSHFATQVVRFERLRARAVMQASRRAELAHLARSLQADLPRHISEGIVSAAEALLLTGALLEVLEPDAQLRAAELAQFSAQFLPPVNDDESS